jgi:hypothetical protein
VSTTIKYRGRERFTLKDCEYYSKLPREREVHTRGLWVPLYTTEGERGTHSRAVGTTVHYRGRGRYTLKDCEYYSKLQREREVHTQGLWVLQLTTEGERGTHSRTMSTTVNYTGRERYTLEGCWYHSTLQRERKVHTQGLWVPQYTTEGERGSHSRAVSTTVHYRGGERFTLKDCEYHSTQQRERKVHTQGLLLPRYTIEGEKSSHSRAVGTTVHYRMRERFTLKGCWYKSTLQRERKVHTQGLWVLQ